MTDTGDKKTAPPGGISPGGQADNDIRLDGGAYDIIRNRLTSHGRDLQGKLEQLNAARKEIFGSIEQALLATERITTDHNCVPCDMVSVNGSCFIFGYNVFMGLKSSVAPADVFSVFRREEQGFRRLGPELLDSGRFAEDLSNLYTYYRDTSFSKFSVIGPHLFMVFQVGRSATDIKTFKWLLEDGNLTYLDNRSDHEFSYPPQQDIEWIRTGRDDHITGRHPHISIKDRLFVESIGGDITFKVENNTETGRGIYAEPVEYADQTLDDAEIHYALMGPIIVVRIRPYQENAYRYFIFNEKTQEVDRADEIAAACVRLPDDHGLIFPNGCYVLSRGLRRFDGANAEMKFESRIASPNGEDFLYVFHDPDSGEYQLLSYNLIAQDVDAPLPCNGFSHFETGEIILFRADSEPAKHHVIQIWQTPYVGGEHAFSEQSDAFLYKIGNPDIVRCMAECHELLRLIHREDVYASLYVDLVKKAGDIADAWFWADKEEAFHLKDSVLEIRSAAAAAIEEYEKVVSLRRRAAEALADVSEDAERRLQDLKVEQPGDMDGFVAALSDLRTLRGRTAALGEMRYADEAAVEKLDARLAAAMETCSTACADFLQTDEALVPYEKRVKEADKKAAALDRVVEAEALEQEVAQAGADLEMLIEITGNLNIADAVKATAIIDAVSTVFAKLNGVRARIVKRKKELAGVEGKAKFNAQLKLLNQSVVNYLDISDTPDKCDEYLTKLMVSLEEMEGKFADFDEFVLQVSEKREEVHAAFESRKLQLVEARNRRAGALMQSAERILSGVKTRIGGMSEIEAIHAYFASDLMIQKVRDIIATLTELGDPVKADDIQSRLKTIREDAVRQLKDRKELFVDGENVIRFGAHAFSVNTRELDLTMVFRDGNPHFHLAGTAFFEPVTDQEFLETRPVWNMEVVSESRDVYRGEYLAWRMLRAAEAGELQPLPEFADLLPSPSGPGRPLSDDDPDFKALLDQVRAFMAPRYAENYTRGIHDLDAARILAPLSAIHRKVGLLRFSPSARTLARLFWSLDYGQADERHGEMKSDPRRFLALRIAAQGALRRLFPNQPARDRLLRELEAAMAEFLDRTQLFDYALMPDAAVYLFEVLAETPTATDGSPGEPVFTAGQPAWELASGLLRRLREDRTGRDFMAARKQLAHSPAAAYSLIRDGVAAWAGGNSGESPAPDPPDLSDFTDFIDEAALLIFTDVRHPAHVANIPLTHEISGLSGDHPGLGGDGYRLNYLRFVDRLRRHDRETVPLYRRFTGQKKELTRAMRETLRLSEFQPRVLTSFVRNRLINQVYLPLIGDNLAKQMGTAGDQTRTDRMGMLLLISPPGYGKTTLMEYIANRLGIIFMKINGPAIGHEVTSIDPSEAPNAGAREEVNKINLALEMGDNIMIYLDDIQHCNPELLQKFISLCDAQRKIEGVWKGRSKTYDLRGKKVAVVMAGNPYTETGGKFRIPDMLANRADTYNLGDIIGDHGEAFKLSYIENCLTSNPALNRLASRSREDIYGLIRMADTGSREGIELEANYSTEEITEMTSVLKKLLVVREVILKVNLAYIESAAQAEEYRTEPPFKLQGSYRNMARIAEKVHGVLNDRELVTLVLSHYENEAQTLAQGAEFNLLKFRELTGWGTEADAARLEEIRRTFRKNMQLHGLDASDPAAQVAARLSGLHDGLNAIGDAVRDGLGQKDAGAVEISLSPDANEGLRRELDRMMSLLEKGASRSAFPEKLEVESRIPVPFLKVMKAQFDVMKRWLDPMMKSDLAQTRDIARLATEIRRMRKVYREVLDARGNSDWRHIERYTAALNADPEDDTTFYKRGLAFYNMGDGIRALSDFKNALDLQAKNKKYQRIVAHLEAELTTDRGDQDTAS